MHQPIWHPNGDMQQMSLILIYLKLNDKHTISEYFDILSSHSLYHKINVKHIICKLVKLLGPNITWTQYKVS